MQKSIKIFKNRKFSKKKIYLQNNLYKFFVWRIKRKATNSSSDFNTSEFSHLLYQHYNIKKCYSAYFSKIQINKKTKLNKENLLGQDAFVSKTFIKKEFPNSRNLTKRNLFKLPYNKNSIHNIKTISTKLPGKKISIPETNVSIISTVNTFKTKNKEKQMSNDLVQFRKTTCLVFFSYFTNFLFFYQKKSLASITPGKFFPHKKSFLCYWVLPFLGFVALTYSKQDYNNKFINSFQLWPFLTSKNDLLNTSTITEKESFNMNENIITKNKNTFQISTKNGFSIDVITEPRQTKNIKPIFIIDSLIEQQQQNIESILVYEDKNFLKQFSKILNSEKNELKNLCSFYIYKTQNWLYAKMAKTSVFFETEQISNKFLQTINSSDLKWFILIPNSSNSFNINPFVKDNSKKILETKILDKNSEIDISPIRSGLKENSFWTQKNQTSNLTLDEFPKKLNLNLINLKPGINDNSTELPETYISDTRPEVKNLINKLPVIFYDSNSVPKTKVLNQGPEIKNFNINPTITFVKKQPILEYNKAKLLLDKYVTVFHYKNSENSSKTKTFWRMSDSNSLKNKMDKAKKRKFKEYFLKYNDLSSQSSNDHVITSDFYTFENKKVKFLPKNQHLYKKKNLVTYDINKKLEQLFLKKFLNQNIVKLMSNDKTLVLKNTNIKYNVETQKFEKKEQQPNFFKQYIFELSVLKTFKTKKNFFKNTQLEKKSFKNKVPQLYFSNLKKMLTTSKQQTKIKKNLKTNVLNQAPEIFNFSKKNPGKFYFPELLILKNNDLKINPITNLNRVNLFGSKNIIEYNQPILMSGYHYPEFSFKSVLNWRDDFKNKFFKNFNNNFQKKNLLKPTLNNLEDSFGTLQSSDTRFNTLLLNENHLTNRKIVFSNEKNFINIDSNSRLISEPLVSDTKFLHTFFPEFVSLTSFEKMEPSFSKNFFLNISYNYITCLSKKLTTILNLEKIQLLEKHHCNKNLNKVVSSISNNSSLDNFFLNTSVLKISKIQNQSKKIFQKKRILTKNISVKKPEKRKIERLLRTYLSNKYSDSDQIRISKFKQTNISDSNFLLNPRFKVKDSNLDFKSKKNLITIILANLKNRNKIYQMNQKQYLNIVKESINLDPVIKTNSKKLPKNNFLNRSSEIKNFSRKPKTKVSDISPEIQNSSSKPDASASVKILKTSVLSQGPSTNSRRQNSPEIHRSFIKDINNHLFLANHQKELNLKRPLSSNSLLKRIGFLFLNQTDREILEKNNQSTFIRVEKQKSQQKKRRRKKLKLENRRRKKRKRFYPRPQWIRTQLFNKFNKVRHRNYFLIKSQIEEGISFSDKYSVIKAKSNKLPKILNLKIKKITPFPNRQQQNLIKNFNSNLSQSVNTKNISSTKSLDTYTQEKNVFLRQKIYRNNKQKWSHYSSETSNFEKLTLKKYTYQNFLPIYANHNLYQISNTLMSDFQRLCWKSYWMRTNLNPYIERVKKYLNKLDNSEKNWQFKNSLKYYLYSILGVSIVPNFYNFVLPHFFWTQTENASLLAVNNQNNLDIPKGVGFLNIKNSLEQLNYISNSSFFLNSINLAEYNRIQFDRISDVIKNVKNNLSVNGQNKARSYKRGRQKSFLMIEKNYWTRLAQSVNPEINGFSPFSQFIDPSIKPYGDLPTVRALWALNKTNLLNFKEANQTKNLWIALKNREQRKSNKTKQFLSKMYKKLCLLQFKSETFNKKNNSRNYFQKIEHSQNKMRYLGFFEPNLKNYLRNFKIKLKRSIFQKDINQNATANIVADKNNVDFYKNKNFKKYSYLKQNPSINSVIKKSSKCSRQFWWSTKEINFQSFLYTSNLKLNDFSFVPSQNLLTFKIYSGENKTSQLFQSTLWACTILFHICALFSLIRISEIRNLFKFHLLVFCKISNIYLVVIYSIFNCLKEYKKQIIQFKTSLKKWLFKINLSTPRQRQYSKEKNVSILFKNRNKLLKTTSLEKKSFQSLRINKTKTQFNYILELNNLANYKKIIKASSKNTKTTLDELFYSCSKNLIKVIPLVNSISYKSNVSNLSETSRIFKNSMNSQDILSKSLLNINKQVKNLITLSIFSTAKFSINFLNNCSLLFYSVLLKFLDILESFMVIIYKFLEKPAELMLEWIAQIFLLEWSSDLYTYAPESFDIYMWNSFSKLSRNLRSMVLGSSFIGGFFLQRRMWCFMELFLDYIMKPDSDLLIRQKKGLIFWEIWAEILIQAAEKYNVNIPSLTTLKEEQELLIERLLEDENWSWCEPSMHQMAPLISLVKNSKPKINVLDRSPDASASVRIPEIENSISKLKTSVLSQGPSTIVKDIISENKTNIKHNNLLLNNYFKVSYKNKFNIITSQSVHFDKWKRWSANQYFTYQGRDTDLFIDIHPPKSFQHMSTIKYYEPSHQPIGTLVCQIYSGVFSKQVSKNILVVGAGGVGKSLLIQALAGETELKIMTDNAHRYGMVQRGVAVGMKLLRDVFEAIALHTPCLFLMEDIHIIGERRPMLISDDENAKAADLSFGSSSDEVHEKNQVIYQLSRHAVSHYKKPYKGDFSLLIPTNHFCFDLFLGVTPPKTRKAAITPEHPLPINTIQNDLEQQSNSNSNFSESSEKSSSILVSRLQLNPEKLFAPPATSPFTVLMMKEQKKIKPRKVVKEIPWSGLSSDQMLLLPKVTYSVRVKVAMLADIAISNLSVKLDMITDLLVIIDSVRSNRGFVVFATTHVPYMLDPALRRPGRLDETISLPLLPNLVSRLEILKTNLLNFSSTLDFLDAAILTHNLNETQISNMISKSKLLLLNMSSKQIFSSKQLETKVPVRKTEILNIRTNLNSNTLSCLPISNVNQASYLILNNLMDLCFYVNKNANKNNLKNCKNFVPKTKVLDKNQETNILATIPEIENFSIKLKTSVLSQGPSDILEDKRTNNLKILKTSNLLAGTYFRISKFLITSTILSDQTSYGLILWNNLPNLESSEDSLFSDLYSPSYDLKNHLLKLLSGKVGEFFVFNNYRAIYSLETSVSGTSSGKNVYKQTSSNFIPNLGPKLWNLAGLDKFWHSATSFVFSLIHKRYLYSKNLLVSRLFYFQDVSILKEPPSPPGSSILNPSKNYENFKRTMVASQQRAVFSINEKIQLHQQQRFIKKLYNKTIKDYFNSEMIENRQTFFTSSFKELGYLDKYTSRPTSVNCYYRNNILTRHKYYFTNQWWNGQLAEHNAETTFLSDVDWRSMFVNSLGDLVIDFPDADQHYNPRKRKWMLNSGYWGYWLTFEKTFQSEIYYHFVMECFNLATNSLDTQREILDYFAYLFLRKGVLKEIDLISTLSRFN